MSAKTKPTKSKATSDKAEKKARGEHRTDEAKAKAAQADGPKADDKTPRKAESEPKPKKLSALDAAARVLGEAGQPMNCLEMIETMATKGYWTSPGGKTPHATLYSGILRELKTKGKDARFKKTERGKFEVNR